MVPISSLWLPILLSAVISFVASSVLHMVLPFHRKDLRKVPKEDDFLDALRRLTSHPATTPRPTPLRPMP